jgi:hypothetical protein
MKLVINLLLMISINSCGVTKNNNTYYLPRSSMAFSLSTVKNQVDFKLLELCKTYSDLIVSLNFKSDNLFNVVIFRTEKFPKQTPDFYQIYKIKYHDDLKGTIVDSVLFDPRIHDTLDFGYIDSKNQGIGIKNIETETGILYFYK